MQKTVNSRNHSFVLSNPYIGPLLGATTPGQSQPGSDGNKGVLHICQSFTIRLFSVISRTPLGESYPSAEKQSVYSTAPAGWVNHFCGVLYYTGFYRTKYPSVRVYKNNITKI